MINKTDFTETEWSAIVDAPQMAGIAVMVAGASGIIGSLKEAAVAAGAVFEGTTHANELIRLISSKDEMKASQERVRAAMGDFGNQDPTDWVRQQTISTVQRAMTILRGKSPETVGVYKDWIMTIADKVANAAKEGGFLGFGGERVSEKEREAIEQLRMAIG